MTVSSRVVVPESLDEALSALAARPELRVVCGGTDVMVGVNEGVTDVAGWLSLRRVAELQRLELTERAGLVGSGVTFARLMSETAPSRTALAAAARTVGSPQIRHAGTVGGNLATASPAADAVPPLLCHDSVVELASVRGSRRVPLEHFATGPKRTVRAPDEIIVGVHLGPSGGVETFAKIGTRNAMVISVCSLAARLDLPNGLARVAIGSVAPTVLRVEQAEAALLDARGADDFADVVASAASPIDDARATASYRRHAIGVLARRSHAWLWRSVNEGAAA